MYQNCFKIFLVIIFCFYIVSIYGLFPVGTITGNNIFRCGNFEKWFSSSFTLYNVVLALHSWIISWIFQIRPIKRQKWSPNSVFEVEHKQNQFGKPHSIRFKIGLLQIFLKSICHKTNWFFQDTIIFMTNISFNFVVPLLFQNWFCFCSTFKTELGLHFWNLILSFFFLTFDLFWGYF